MKGMKHFINLIIDSLKGVEHDYTKGSIRTAILLLAVPMVLELSLESVFALVDMFFVGKLGKNAITTVGLTESVITIVYSIAIGLSTAATAIVSRRIGEKNPAAASNAAVQVIIVSLICTFIISTFGFYFASDVLRWMGASDEVVKEGTIFTRIMFAGSFVIIQLFLINGIFRGAGNASIAMKSLWISSGLNIILCPLLIYTFGLGLKGAAIATTLGRGAGVAYQCYHLWKGNEQLQIRHVSFKPDWKVIRSIITIALPATIQFVIASASWIYLAKLVAETGGTSASAGYQIAIRNVVFFILPAWGMSNAAATLVGQNLGAGQPDRAIRSVMLTTFYNVIFMTFVTILFVFLPSPIIRFFSTDELVIKFGVQALRTIGYGYIFYGIGMVIMQALNGAGDTKTPTIINFVCFWMIQIPLAYLASNYFKLGPTGAFMAIPIAESLIAIVAFVVFRNGKWKNVKV